MRNADSVRMDVDIVLLRIRGQKFVFPLHSLLKYPDSKLGQIAETIVKDQLPTNNATNGFREGEDDAYITWRGSEKSTHELKFDRDPVIFGMIHNFYLSDHLHIHNGVCMTALETELEFWQIDADFMSICCWQQLQTIKDNERTLERIKQEWYDIWFIPESLPAQDGWAMKLLVFLEYPNSSKAAKVS